MVNIFNDMASLCNLSLILLSFQCLPTISIALQKHYINTDKSALIALKSGMLDPSNMLLDWNFSTRIPVCNWTGVICSVRHDRVVSLNLSHVGLQGSISPQIRNLSFLTYIHFEGNNLQGNLPEEMLHLQRLRYINLDDNSFSGDVPAWLGSLQNLESISFVNNGFTGAIPVSLFNASKLEYLSISFNHLHGNMPRKIGENGILKFLDIEGNMISGFIPDSIFNLTSLEFLGLTTNSLSGSIPLNICSKLQRLQGIFVSDNMLSGQIQSRFSNCSQLLVLSASMNHFNGGIPTDFGNQTTLTNLLLGRNNFTGQISTEIGDLLNLEVFDVGENGLVGEIPKEIGNLQKLTKLALNTNGLSGRFSLSILNMSSLETISLTQNNISGTLPPYISNNQLPNLQELYLSTNRLSGVIPNSISQLTKLTALDLGNNQFTGSIPLSLGTLTFLNLLDLEHNHLTVDFPPELNFLTSLTNCSKLDHIYLTGNPLKGRLPNGIGNFSTSLRVFRANSCKMEGNIPHEIGNVTGLIDLDLGGNLNLNGPFPMEFGMLKNLQSLDLSDNQISGHIPNYFCSFKQLDFLNLGGNQLIGQVPKCFGNMNSLSSLYLYSNKLNSTLPSSLGKMSKLLHLDVDSNSFRGDIPKEIGNIRAAILIDLSGNNFTGLIPASIGGLDNLINLSLSYNQLHGSIPEKLSNMVNLELFDLSHNNLTGNIPKSLASLQQLKYFNVSFNKLGGEIPSNGSFRNFTNESFMSNGVFCGGPPHLQYLPCPTNSTRISSVKRLRLIERILIPVCLAVFVAVGSIIICILKGTKNKDISSQTDDRISFFDLQKATNGFNESNLLASGSYGSLYKGVLKDGTIIEAKVFNLEVEGSFNSFDRECEVLRNVRHRNLVKVITSCSNLDFKALVLEYMPNGSLEKWLYSHNYFLNFSKRLDIVIDVASALVYLHHGYSSIIVHCDLKPGNVLLDEDMTGRVCDFGIAKLFAGDESMAHTKTLATIGYIAPEYGFEGKVSASCDVYSFGILLMETFSRKKPTDEMFTEDWGLRDWVVDSLTNSSTDFIDQNLIRTQDGNLEKVMRCVSNIMELALACTVESMKDRINMEFALAKLENLRYHSTQRS